MLRDLVKFGSRAVLGGYVAAHGAQKLVGAFGGKGLEGTGRFFESIGLQPGKEMAALAAAGELGGGALTVLGHLHPVGPIAVASTMGVAAATAHRGNGAFATNGGPELAVAYLSGAVALAACGPGRLVVGKQLPGWVGAVAGVAAAAAAAALIDRAALALAGDELAEVDEVDEPQRAFELTRAA